MSITSKIFNIYKIQKKNILDLTIFFNLLDNIDNIKI